MIDGSLTIRVQSPSAQFQPPQGAFTVAKTTGTSGNDRLFGTNGRDTMQGLAGNDLIEGRGGDDFHPGRPGQRHAVR